MVDKQLLIFTIQCILIFVVIFINDSIAKKAKKKKDAEDNYVTYAPYKFEGVNFGELPEELQTEYLDCFGQLVRCLRHRTFLEPVCGIIKTYVKGNITDSTLKNFSSVCQLELYNCEYTERSNKTYEIAYYNGDPDECYEKYVFTTTPQPR